MHTYIVLQITTHFSSDLVYVATATSQVKARDVGVTTPSHVRVSPGHTHLRVHSSECLVITNARHRRRVPRLAKTRKQKHAPIKSICLAPYSATDCYHFCYALPSGFTVQKGLYATMCAGHYLKHSRRGLRRHGPLSGISPNSIAALAWRSSAGKVGAR